MPPPLNHQHLRSQEDTTGQRGQRDKHNDVSWKPRERQVKAENSPEGEARSRQKRKGQSGSLAPQSFNTTGKDTHGRKGRKAGAAATKLALNTLGTGA